MQFMYTDRATTFTIFGRDVQLYILGESNRVQRIGGMRMLSLSTSSSSPETVRVAAQMRMGAPALPPEQ